jgi:xylulokinase
MFVGIDLGTSGVKVVAVDADGRLAAKATASYALDTPRPGWAEQDPERWWDATVEATQRLADDVDASRVQAIGLSGQMHTLVLLDEGGRPVRPAISWADTRTESQARRMRERVPRETLVGALGNPPATGFTAPSLMWVKEHDAPAYRGAAKLCLVKDYVRLRLTGAWATDPSDASATLLFDTFRRTWSDEVLDALELDAALLPPVHASGDVAGELRTDAAASLGLPRGTPVVTGAGDQAAAATGCGLVDPGPMLVTLGSGGQVFTPLAAPAADPELRVHLFCHAAPDRWHLQGAVQNMGVALDWVRCTLGWSWEELYGRAAEIPAGAEGVTFLPYLTGERTPYMDPLARAAWSGLALSHTPAHMARAAIEGAAYAMADAIEACTEAGGEPDEIALTGGGAEHALPRQILADVVGRSLGRAQVRDASAVGAAVLAGAPVPGFRSTEAEAPGPDAEAHRAAWRRQRDTYAAVRDARPSPAR